MASNHTFASANRRHVRHKPSGYTFIAAAVRGLHLVCPAGLFLDPLRQALVARSDFSHCLPSLWCATIAPWRWMDGTGFFAGQGTFIHATGRNDRKGGYVWIGAKTEHLLQFLRPYVGNGWDYVAI